MSKIATSSLDPFLVEYAAGARLRATKPIQSLLAPTVTVGSLLGRFKNYDKDARLCLPTTLRALNARAVRLEISNIDDEYACQINALDVPLDTCLADDLKWVAPDALDLLAEIEEQVLEYETIARAIAGAGAGSAMTWDASADPVKLIDEKLLLLAKAARSDGLGVAFGAQAWHVFKNHPKVIARGGASISWASHPNLFHAGARFETAYSLYDTAREGLAAVADFMFPESAILLVARSEKPSRRSPNFMTTFRLKNAACGLHITPSADGRVLLVRNDWAVDLKEVNTAGVARFNIAES